MLKFTNVTPLNNFQLKILINDGTELLFDVMAEIKKISSYYALQNHDFFKRVKFTQYRIYWDCDHDFHIDQVLHLAKRIPTHLTATASLDC